MNTLTRTIAVLIALSMLTAGLALAQDVPAAETREADAAGREAEIAVRTAHRQAEAAQKQAEATLKQKDASLEQAVVALAKVESVPGPVPPVLPGTRYSGVSRRRWPFQSSGTASVLVIPSAEIETRDLLTINEDMNVMARIFATNLQRARISPSGGSLFIGDYTRRFDIFSSRSGNSIQSLYLQGYGVLFLMKVDFPLSPSKPAQEPDETEKEQDGDEVWRNMRLRLYEPEKLSKRKDDSAAKYDAEKVENLKTTVINALKHASNIRSLKPDESVILTITGSGTSAVLTIRVKKSDTDSFSKGDLDLEQFRQRVQILSYPYVQVGFHRSDKWEDYSDMFEDYQMSAPKSMDPF